MVTRSRFGFTIVEVIVAISIISILSALAFTAFYNARKEARDSIRVSTAEQMKLGVRLYKEQHDTYPSYPNGRELGVHADITAELEPFLPGIELDPLERSDSAAYGYWYDSDFTCTAAGQTVIYIKKTEQQESANFDGLCTHPNAGNDGAGSDSYVVILGDNLGNQRTGYSQGSYYSQSAYYGQNAYYAQNAYYTQSTYYSQSAYYIDECPGTQTGRFNCTSNDIDPVTGEGNFMLCFFGSCTNCHYDRYPRNPVCERYP